MTDFNRADYYSQTEICKLFKVSPKKLKSLIEANNIPVITRPIEIGYDRGNNFNVAAKYILKTDWDKITK